MGSEVVIVAFRNTPITGHSGIIELLYLSLCTSFITERDIATGFSRSLQAGPWPLGDN
jgi:hypothetical protein